MPPFLLPLTLLLTLTTLLLNTFYSPPTMSTAPPTTMSTPPVYEPYTLHQSLPAHLLPTPTNARRLLIVGDVHGMLAPLQALLAKAHFTPATDTLVFVGDMVCKGPDSAGVVALAQAVGAWGVRGNHEDLLLRRVGRAAVESGAPAPGELTRDNRTHKDKKEGGKTEKEDPGLTNAHLQYLAALPLVLDLGVLAGPLGHTVVVHAGLAPGKARQHPWVVMNMRSLVARDSRERNKKQAAGEAAVHFDDDESGVEIASLLHDEEEYNENWRAELADADDAVHGSAAELRAAAAALRPVDSRQGRRWAAVWNAYQATLTPAKRTTVVYGHDAGAGLQLGRHTLGLDSNCFRGGRLTAVVIGAGADREKEAGYRLVQVECDEHV